MMRVLRTFIVLFITTGAVLSQETIPLPAGITAGLGIGNFGVTDQYISAAKYAGLTNNFYTRWDKDHQNSHTRIAFGYQYGEKIANHNVSAQVRQFSLRRANLYPVATESLFSRDVAFYLGPSTESFIHLRRQQIASGGAAFRTSYSFAALFSLGINGELVTPLSEKTGLRLGSNLSLLSAGLRIIDLTGESNDSPLKLLIPFTGMTFSANVSIDYRLHRRVALSTGYDLFVSRITAWENFLVASDNLFISLRFFL
ncbi:MAG: hypothetical protein K9N46_01755 [Candidatus Marinimicrobia bacterium]|nr:hypothetical protein [Candidatus Neomarinimicrobiota bacterium]MCF7827798.1 hypothetical protein [Candidatus Neomarinimicrobiota bacterium]MCF7879447.1 hypothetical protein [Candidatus Neomarinimicrobiota bacterium]